MLKAVQPRRPNGRSKPGEPVPKPYPYAAPAPPFPTDRARSPRECRCTPAWASTAAPASDRFGTVGPPGGEPNACAGQGYCSTAVDHTCHVQNQCRGQGGCGLYGTGEEMNNPGANDCRSLRLLRHADQRRALQHQRPQPGQERLGAGARRCSRRTGPRSARNCSHKQASGRDPARPAAARDARHRRRRRSPTPARPTCGSATTTTQRGNMTACGASGLSGAGGCS